MHDLSYQNVILSYSRDMNRLLYTFRNELFALRGPTAVYMGIGIDKINNVPF